MNYLYEFNRILKIFPNKVIIIDFWADWCSPCNIFSPIFARAQEDHSSDFIFVKINVDDNPRIVQHFKITSISTTLFLKKDQILKKLIGNVNFETLRQMLEN